MKTTTKTTEINKILSNTNITGRELTEKVQQLSSDIINTSDNQEIYDIEQLSKIALQMIILYCYETEIKKKEKPTIEKITSIYYTEPDIHKLAIKIHKQSNQAYIRLSTKQFLDKQKIETCDKVSILLNSKLSKYQKPLK